MRSFIFALLILGASWTGARGQTVILQNNQPFPWRLPVRVHLSETTNDPHGHPAQKLGNDILFIADAPASSTSTISLQSEAATVSPTLFFLEAENKGVRLTASGHDLGRLTWGLILTNSPDYQALFKPLPFSFQKKARGPVFDQWMGSVTNAGLEIQIELLAYAGGFLDINAHLANQSADPEIKTHAAVVCRWQQPSAASQTLCYDNHIQPLTSNGRSPFRAGSGRQMFIQRGVDWVRASFENGTTVAWLNDFAPSFTVLDNSTKNPFHAPRYAGANLPQLGQEVQTVSNEFFSITEIARDSVKSFSDRMSENVLPARGEGISFSSRLIFSNANLIDSDIDHAFVAYAGYNPQKGSMISCGVPSVRFGTSYFPYSTFGENFDDLKLPGMDREGFWPLAADTVLQWKLFANDIRRDLRMAKAMGFQLIRLHHLELLAPIPRNIRQEYLDFIFSELRRLHLRALLDVYASPNQLTDLVTRYRDVIDAVELENETLIWGIPLDRPAQWKADYDAIKKAAPEVQVCLTGYNNTGMFNRLNELGVPYDRIDLHSYLDSIEAIPSGRGYALALGSYATKAGRPPMISEWNWRGLTRMSEEARAKIYSPIIESAVGTRAIPDFYEFQFNETMAPNPRLGRGNLLRHYELLNLSRRPKLEALELAKIIERYSEPASPLRIITSSHEAVELDEQDRVRVNISLTNNGGSALKLRAMVENFDGLTIKLGTNSRIEIPPGKNFTIPIDIVLPNRVPGFYHVFVRLETDAWIRYLWAEVRVPGAPKIESGQGEQFDLSKPVTVAYGEKATVLEVETAFALGQTLESATGRIVPIVPLSDIPEPLRAHLIVVGSTRDAIAPQPGWLMIGGDNSREVEKAGMDFILRYWKFAKDSAARRVGLARKDLPKGGDAAKLP